MEDILFEWPVLSFVKICWVNNGQQSVVCWDSRQTHCNTRCWKCWKCEENLKYECRHFSPSLLAVPQIFFLILIKSFLFSKWDWWEVEENWDYFTKGGCQSRKKKKRTIIIVLWVETPSPPRFAIILNLFFLSFWHHKEQLWSKPIFPLKKTKYLENFHKISPQTPPRTPPQTPLPPTPPHQGENFSLHFWTNWAILELK